MVDRHALNLCKSAIATCGCALLAGPVGTGVVGCAVLAASGGIVDVPADVDAIRTVATRKKSQGTST